MDRVIISIVGAGGLGTPAASALVSACTERSYPFLIRLIDGDKVELSNLNRQVLFSVADIGEPKVLRLAAALREQSPLVQIESHETHLTSNNIEHLLAGSHLVIDATDSVQTKFEINDFCVLRGIPFCYAGVSGKKGQILAVDPSHKGQGCLRCLFGEFGEADYQEQTTTCQHAGIFGPFVGLVGLLQAEAGLGLLFSKSTKSSRLLRLSLDNLETRELEFSADTSCPLGCVQRTFGQLELLDKRCPETFLYTKLALDKLQDGSFLRVKLGYDEDASSVIRTCQENGFYARQNLSISENPNSLCELFIAKLPEVL